MDQAVLFMCHVLNEETQTEYKKIARAVRSFGDAWLAFHVKRPAFRPHLPGTKAKGRTQKAACPGTRGPDAVCRIPRKMTCATDELRSEKAFCFTDDDLKTLGCPQICESIVPGSAHFPLMLFFRAHPHYHYYWVIEYDVRFSGRWSDFFRSFMSCRMDFVTSHIRGYDEEPKWCWWALDHPHDRIPLSDRLRSFNPIYRISNLALARLHALQRSGWCGHFEVLMPTLLFHAGFQLADFGGHGQYVAARNRNRFYIDAPRSEFGSLEQGTMRWRPVFERVGIERNKLYHPIKVS